MKKTIIIIALFTCVAVLFAQRPQQQQSQEPQTQEQMQQQVQRLQQQVQQLQQQVQQQSPPQWNSLSTELYQPVPPKVIPGNPISKPPSDAIILFDGTNLDKWESSKPPTVAPGERRRRPDPAPWKIENGTLVIVPNSGGIQTKEYFGDCQLHIEFKSPPPGNGIGQNRGNSGIFLQNTYEIQVLDGDNNPTYVNGMVGSLYKQAAPMVNAYTKNGEWQVYDIIWKAPVFDSNGLVSPAMATVMLNGIVIHNNYILTGDTPFAGLPTYKPHGRLPLSLQDHGEAILFRNIWIRNL